ncbi:GNAT family N-acetyltransferase [Rhizobium leguminosarum]
MLEVRPTTQIDLEEIKAWLEIEDRAHREWEAARTEERWFDPGPTKGFLCNFDSYIRPAFDNGDMFTFINGGEAIGFSSGGLTERGIFEIRPDMRGTGLGRWFANWMIERAKAQGTEAGLYIDCAPRSSLDFWVRMGFTHHKESYSGEYAYMLLPRNNEVPKGRLVKSEISVLEKLCDELPDFESRPLFGSVVDAIEDQSGNLHFAQRLILPAVLWQGSRHPWLRVVVEGVPLIFDELYDLSRSNAGPKRDRGGFYFIDAIETLGEPILELSSFRLVDHRRP